MTFNISSESLANPLLVDILQKLTVCFQRIGQTYFVIGATARDILLQQLAGTNSRRKTRDLDIAIAIPDWNRFHEISEGLGASGFDKDPRRHQRFYFGDYELDIVPYGDVMKDDDNIYWPPVETIAMSVKGFDEVLSDAITVTIDHQFDIKIASLHGLFLLKFNAWQDRGIADSKDAEDMSFILSNYFMANVERNFHHEVFDWDDLDEYVAGAYWLAHDLTGLLNHEQLVYYRDAIRKEISKEESSLLIHQILDHSYILKYEQVYEAWRTIAEVFDKNCRPESLWVKDPQGLTL